MRKTRQAVDGEELDNVFRITELFIANAKTYVQLSGGAMLLTVAFAREVLGVKEGEPIPGDWSLVASWIFFLLATLSGVSYQYLAVRFLEAKSGVPIHHRFDWPKVVKDNPWAVYGAMLGSFYLGAVCFTITALRHVSAYTP